MFVAVGYNLNVIVYSYDGVTWQTPSYTAQLSSELSTNTFLQSTSAQKRQVVIDKNDAQIRFNDEVRASDVTATN